MATATTKTFRFLTLAQVIKLHSSLISNAKPTQPTLLDSAIASPMNIFQLAANLSEEIMKNHAYQDGNKRIALVAADMFLKINGYKIQRKPMAHDAMNDGVADALVLVATNQWDAKKLGEYYESIAKPVQELSADRAHHYSTG
ncbi:hypothetical protein VE02_01738 [Pseudogymnoascus sp. 03VT05]|nr:hypothetical protein VE02_01738 [Pseudogymnoascus sp. 03VT05]